VEAINISILYFHRESVLFKSQLLLHIWYKMYHFYATAYVTASVVTYLQYEKST